MLWLKLALTNCRVLVPAAGLTGFTAWTQGYEAQIPVGDARVTGNDEIRLCLDTLPPGPVHVFYQQYCSADGTVTPYDSQDYFIKGAGIPVTPCPPGVLSD
jgi:hypothetical protein